MVFMPIKTQALRRFDGIKTCTISKCYSTADSLPNLSVQKKGKTKTGGSAWCIKNISSAWSRKLKHMLNTFRQHVPNYLSIAPLA